ncbi:MAG: hypothetical protein HS127_10165 [Planctomycetia bacterium]|nr:hypothetical protein [Planctomycetia bacterium]
MPDSIKVIVMDKLYSVYIMANKINTVLYTWVPNNLKRRVYGHREKRVEVSYDGYYEVASEKTLAMTSGCFRKDKLMLSQRQADAFAKTSGCFRKDKLMLSQRQADAFAKTS